MDFLILIAAFFQLMFCAVEYAYLGEFIFILPLFGYIILGELACYAFWMMSTEKITSGTGNENYLQVKTLDVKNDSLKAKYPPIVRNPVVWSQCKMLGLDAKLEFPQGANIMVVNGIPFVHSMEIYLFCQALDLKVDMLL